MSPDPTSPVPLTKLERGVCLHTLWILPVFILLTLFSIYLSENNTLPDFTDVYRTIGLQPMNAAGFAGVFALFIAVRPSTRQLQVVTAVGIVLEFLYLQNFDPRVDWLMRLSLAGGGLFVASVFGFIYRSIWAPFKEDRWRARAMLRLAAIIVFYPRFADLLYTLLTYATPLVYDSHGLIVEMGIGTAPSFEIARFMVLHDEVGEFALNVYSRLPLFMSLAFCLTLWNPLKTYNNIYFGFLWAGLFGYFFYPLLPMVGIDLFLGDKYWPFGPLPAEVPLKLVPAPDNYPRSCFPSLHGTWILMIYFSVYRISRRANLGFLFLVVWTMLGTLSAPIGHYLLDLVVAFPFALANMAISTIPTDKNRQIRLQCVVFGLVSTVALALAIRWFPLFLAAHPYLFWLGSATLIGLSCWAERRLGNVTLSSLPQVDPSID